MQGASLKVAVTHPSSLQRNSTVTIFIADDAGILGVLTLQFVASPFSEGWLYCI